MNRRMEKTVPGSTTGAISLGWEMEGICQLPLAPPSSWDGSLWGTTPPGFTALQSSCNFGFNFAVRNITLYLFIHPPMLRGSTVAVSGRDASSPPAALGAGAQAGLWVPAPPRQPWEPQRLGHSSH